MNTPSRRPSDSGAWRGKAAVVTGAAGGIGLALAERFAAEGMRVLLSDIAAAPLAEQVERLRGQGHTVWGVAADVRSAESMEALAAFADAHCGDLHLVCNNAGIGGGAADERPLWEAGVGDWQWVLDINLWGVIHGIRAFVPRLLRHGEPAHVVNTASRAGLISSTGLYSTSKHAVVALTEALQAQLMLAGSAVRASVLCPGAVRTDLGANSQRLRPVGDGGATDTQTPAYLQAYRERVRSRMASGMTPAELAEHLLAGLARGEFYIQPGSVDDTPVQARLHNVRTRRIDDPALAFPQFDWRAA